MFKVDDKVTIRRGKHRGPGVIVLEADAAGQIGVRTDAGFVFVTNAENLKAPEEVTITATALGAALDDFGYEVPTDVMDRLEKAAPGITECIIVGGARTATDPATS